MVNKKIGNEFEKRFLELLGRNGYWCHLFAYNQNGQPCDIIACKDNEVFLIDVKHCEEDRFSFDKIQPNQLSCFEYASYCGNDNTGFAIWFEKQKKWYFLRYKVVKELLKFNDKSIKYNMLDEVFIK